VQTPNKQPQQTATSQQPPSDSSGQPSTSGRKSATSNAKKKKTTNKSSSKSSDSTSNQSSGSTTKTGTSGSSGGSSSGGSGGSGSGNSGGGSSGSGSGGSGGSSSLKLGVPVYWWPGTSTYDTQMTDAGGSKIGFAIANINSGPGTGGTQSNFNTQINNERTAGIKVYGYVWTNYGSQPLATAETDIDNWYSWYNLDGILFDGAPGTGWSSAQKTYYKTLYDYVKAKTGAKVHGKTVVLNPGTITDEYAMSVSDIVSDYEDVEANYAGATFPSWTKNYAATRFFHVIHTSGGISQMQADISLAKTRNVGYVFVTTDTTPNPYDTLPSNPFWTDELNAL
jgi:Spherulation-specific family 4